MDMLVKVLADGLLLVIIGIGGASLLWELRKDFWRRVPVVVMAGLTSLLVGKIMSVFYQPETMRPFEKLGVDAGAAYINNPGFPSDHALLATVIVVAVYALTKNNRLTILLTCLVIVMSAARVFALVHTPIDVVFGILAGLSGGIWYKKLTK